MRRISLTILFLITATAGLFGQTLTKFSYSDCLTDCKGDSSKIQSINKMDGQTEIIFRTFAPCGGNFKGELKLLTPEKIDLRFSVKPTKYKNKKGETYEIIEIADCDCPFEFTYGITGLKDIESKQIMVNGRTFLEINKRYYPTEIKIEFDSIR